MGAWFFVSPRLEVLLEELGAREPRPAYAGRPSSASPATGFASQHAREQARLVEDALGVEEAPGARKAAAKAEHEKAEPAAG